MMSRSTVTTGVSRSETVILDAPSCEVAIGADTIGRARRPTRARRSTRRTARDPSRPSVRAAGGRRGAPSSRARMPGVADIDGVQPDATLADHDLLRVDPLGDRVVDAGLQIHR